MHTARPHATRRRILSSHVALGAFTFIALAACNDDPLSSAPEALNQDGPEQAVSTLAASNTWATQASMPTARRGLVSATVDGYVYAIGGADANHVTLQTVERYLPTGRFRFWVSRAPLPEARSFASGAVAINGKIYVVGGRNAQGAPTQSLFVYTHATNSWAQKADLPVPSAYGGAAAINGKLYVFTPGAPLGNIPPKLHRYDPATDTWTLRATPPNHHTFPAAGALDGKFYVAGGDNGVSTATATLDVYDPATNSWTTKAPMPTARFQATGRAMGGKFYVLGGKTSLNNYTTIATVEAYDPLTNMWTTKAPMPTARWGLAATVAEGILYALGGASSQSLALSTAEAYTP